MSVNYSGAKRFSIREIAEFVQVCAAYGVPSGVDPESIRTPEEPAVEEEEGEEAPAAQASEYANEEKVR